MNFLKVQDDIRKWVEEDIQYWDNSSYVLESKLSRATIYSKDEGVISGTVVIREICNLYGLNLEKIIEEGSKISNKEVIAIISGPSDKILQVERVMLNIVSHMSGISTMTRKLVEKVQSVNSQTRVAATRKTLPGLRLYQKWAVLIGGGDTHRMTLSSMIMLKENHLSVLGGISKAIKTYRENSSFSLKIEVEVRNNEEAIEAVMAGADVVMLDNYTPQEILEILPKLRKINSNVLLEASGNINEDTILPYAKTGVDIVSLGKLTHSSTVFDMSMLFENV